MTSKKLLSVSSNLKQLVRFEHTRPLSEIYPRLGNREIVGHGMNGQPSYVDNASFPAPAVRFKENTKEILALREKEKGPWKDLTMQEKKALYRASFCKTYVEMDAPTGHWKIVLTLALGAISVALWVNIVLRKFILPPVPRTVNDEWRRASVEKMVQQRLGHLDGVSSKWDYENNKWK